MPDVLTPLAKGPATALGQRRWRKQVLPVGSITYKGKRLDFTPGYLRDIVDAFRDRSHDTVPFVLADKTNSHTMAAERGAYGEIEDLEVDLAAVDPDTGQPAPGLYAIARLEPEAERIVRRNKRFGVSVRVKPNYERADGKHYKAALQHVLGTWDPVVTALAPWSQTVDLSNEQGDVLDLSAFTYDTDTDQEEATVAGDDTTADTSTDTSVADTTPPAWFQAWLDAGAPGVMQAMDYEGAPGAEADVLDEDDQPGEDEHEGEADAEAADGLTDAEWDALFDGIADDIAAEAADDGDDDGVDGGDDYGADDETDDHNDPAADAEDGAAAEVDERELVTTSQDAERIAALELSNAQLIAERDAAAYEAERTALARRAGLPPDIIDLARPLLEGEGQVIELSNGGAVNAGDIVRDLIKAIGNRMQLLDLSTEVGPGDGDLLTDPAVGDPERQRTSRASLIAATIEG